MSALKWLSGLKLMMIERTIIYADYAATTPMREEVFAAMRPFFERIFGNASGYHSFAREARDAVEGAREITAKAVGAFQKNEIVFTSGGTESNDLALRGLALAHGNPGDRVLVSAIEHAAVEQPLALLQKLGFEVVTIPVDQDGVISVQALEQQLDERTILVSAMMVNNEVGTIQPIKEIGELLVNHRALFHTDAGQGVRISEIDVNDLGVDAMSLSGHKIYGPKGIGALWIRSGVEVVPALAGGGQERGLRGGTENVPGIVGLAKALELANQERESENCRLKALCQRVLQELPKRIEGCQLTGHPIHRHPGIASFVIEDAEGEVLLLQLDRLGVAASTGSACSTRTGKTSKVLQAMGIDERRSRGSLRLSFGLQTTNDDVRAIIERTTQAVELTRALC